MTGVLVRGGQSSDPPAVATENPDSLTPNPEIDVAFQVWFSRE